MLGKEQAVDEVEPALGGGDVGKGAGSGEAGGGGKRC